MFYREAGDFSTTYAEDNQTFPIKFDRYRYYVVLFVAIFVIPFIINDYWANSFLLPFLAYSIAAIGLNILTGYCGQVSLGTGGFMAVGAYACYKFMTGVDIWWGGELLFRLPEFNIFFSVIIFFNTPCIATINTRQRRRRCFIGYLDCLIQMKHSSSSLTEYCCRR